MLVARKVGSFPSAIWNVPTPSMMGRFGERFLSRYMLRMLPAKTPIRPLVLRLS